MVRMSQVILSLYVFRTKIYKWFVILSRTSGLPHVSLLCLIILTLLGEEEYSVWSFSSCHFIHFVDLALFGPYSMLFMNTLNVYSPLH